MAVDNKTVARFNLDSTSLISIGVPQIEVTSDIDDNVMFKVSATDKEEVSFMKSESKLLQY